MKHMEALAVDERLGAVRNFYQFSPSIRGLLFDGAVLTFFKESLYVAPLWTIHVEFIGVFMITLIASYSAKCFPRPRIYYFLMGLFLVCTNEYGLFSFLFGALAYDCIDRLDTDDSRFGRICRALLTTRALRAIVVLVAFYLAGKASISSVGRADLRCLYLGHVDHGFPVHQAIGSRGKDRAIAYSQGKTGRFETGDIRIRAGTSGYRKLWYPVCCQGMGKGRGSRKGPPGFSIAIEGGRE